jgi:hypothetical protein
MSVNYTKASNRKVVREVKNYLKEKGLFSNLMFVYNGKRELIGSSELILNNDRLNAEKVAKKLNNEEVNNYYETQNGLKYYEPKVETDTGYAPSDYGGNDNTFVLSYDGGPLYSAMSGEFGWGSKDKFMNKMEEILDRYDMRIKIIDNISLTIAPK